MKKIVIFDMNGVIINDEALHEKAFASVLKQLRIILTKQEYLDIFAGRTDKAGFENAIKKFGINHDINVLLKQKSAAYLKLIEENIETYPGVIDLIKDLNKNFILALSSSALKKEIDLILKYFGLKKIFKIIISGEDIANSKPNPEAYLKIINKLDVRPEDCIIIEDSRSGIEAAKAAGAVCIAILTTHNKKSLRKADYIANNFNEVKNYIYNN